MTDSANINRLEDIQRKFTSKFQRFREFDNDLGMTICTTSYEERLKALKLHSLQRRRERYLIIYMFKIKDRAGSKPRVRTRLQEMPEIYMEAEKRQKEWEIYYLLYRAKAVQLTTTRAPGAG